MPQTKTIMDAKAIDDAITMLGEQIVSRHQEIKGLALIGIHTRGVFLAERLCDKINQITGKSPLRGVVDINLYRDDWTRISHHPVIRSTKIEFPIDDMKLLMVDDVLFTGRTARAAMEAIIDFGRPCLIELCVLVDRGHRELPIHADYAGKKIKTKRSDLINVLLVETDGIDRVEHVISDK